MSDRIVLNIICFKKKLNTLNNIEALLTDALFDLRARNFVHAKISLRARCVHARDRARNLASPDFFGKVSKGQLKMVNVNH